jgi:1,4-alpha-glucan branching enzyme
MDVVNNVMAFIRKNTLGERMICVFNFSPIKLENYGLGVDQRGTYLSVLDTEETKYGGKGKTVKTYHSIDIERHGKKQSLVLDLEPNQGILLIKS